MSKTVTNAVEEQDRLSDRIRQLYSLLNDRKFEECFKIVDPRLRNAGKITFEVYANSLSHFIQKYGPLHLMRIDGLKLFIDANVKNEDRGFAYALVVAHDKNGRPMQLRERWVKEADGSWYTRKLGLV
ncbi:MAG TPA: hypothetical protein VFW87_09410 [Pirellulales bacterium]|nr:hypothetical protein [Pirellulales bacterium]